MITIQISSDPYKRKITYDIVDGDQLVPIIGSNPEISERSKLLSVDYKTCFFPFKAYEIVKVIQETYRGTPICIRFKGTNEEYSELCKVCEILNKENSEQPPESQLPLLTYEQANEYLANASDILSEVKKYFEKTTKIVDEKTSYSESKQIIEQQREKFDDVKKKEIPVCAVGNYSSGKSTFINALIGSEVLPSGDKPLTAKIYEIRCSDNSEVADVEFTSHDMEITISFYRGGYTIRPDKYCYEVSQTIRDCLEKEKENGLAVRVQSLLKIINSEDIDDRVIIHVPFNSDSPLRSSEHPYVLFDTPGDGAANHDHHIQVLQEALHGMSNGLMLYITESKQMQSEQNQDLCEKIRAIQEIDTRFTMVIVNQADSTNFSDYKREEVLESVIPRALQPEGIYYVSSIMALGAKCNGDLINEYYADTYDTNKAKYLKKKDERFSKLLYLFNIAPKQIEIESENGAVRYSEFGEKEKILANIGLWSIEQEIQRFAENYAPYNKCYQSLLFLLKVREIAENDIAEAVRMHDKSRAEYQSQLEKGIKKLIADLTATRDGFVEKAMNGYPTEMEVSKNDAYTPIAKAELVELEAELTAELESAVGYSERVAIADKAKEKTFRIQNIFNAEVRADMATSYQYWREKSTERDNAREEIDTAAADQLLAQVKEKFNLAVTRAQTILFQSSSNYWKTQAEELRKQLLIVVLASPDISQEKRAELQGLIEGFEQIAFTGEIEKIFEREIFERHAFFKIFEDHRLNKRKLTSRFNSSLKEGIDDIYLQMKSSHKQIFTDWQKRLYSVIEDNITDLNPELREAKKQVTFYKGLIESLRAAQEALNEYIEKINQLMDWKPVIEESPAEE